MTVAGAGHTTGSRYYQPERTVPTMLELKTKKELEGISYSLASSLALVHYRNTLYSPMNPQDGVTGVAPVGDQQVWVPLSMEDLRLLAATYYDTLFASDSELRSFQFMTAQQSVHQADIVDSLLLHTPQGIRQLTAEGKIEQPTGGFVPNTIEVMLNEDEEEKSRVFSVISNWLDSEEEAVSLLRHLATALAPGYSAVKYVLLLGEGRNGKSLLLKMVQALIGQHNVSNVTRQHMSENSPVVPELNGKLVNIVFDGQATYLKDSGAEKTLIAGETYPIRRLYESNPTPVQTNALFLEGLNREPKSVDKTSALQKRLVRFHFPNVYPLDHKFERLMLSEESLGAFLSLLIDHYVLEDELAEKLAPTQGAMVLQLEHMYVNSLGAQYLKYLMENDILGVDSIIGSTAAELTQAFTSWRVKENDIGQWSEPDVLQQFAALVNTERKSKRINGAPRKVKVVTSFKEEAIALINQLTGDEADAEDLDSATLVAEIGELHEA